YSNCTKLDLHSFPTRRSSDLISWGDYKSENGNEIINILPYQNNKIDSSDPLSSFISHNNMEYELQYGNHTHPGFWRTNTVEQWVDRKSTRLNSSHVKISYAVF